MSAVVIRVFMIFLNVCSGHYSFHDLFEGLQCLLEFSEFLWFFTRSAPIFRVFLIFLKVCNSFQSFLDFFEGVQCFQSFYDFSHGLAEFSELLGFYTVVCLNFVDFLEFSSVFLNFLNFLDFLSFLDFFLNFLILLNFFTKWEHQKHQARGTPAKVLNCGTQSPRLGQIWTWVTLQDHFPLYEGEGSMKGQWYTVLSVTCKYKPSIQSGVLPLGPFNYAWAWHYSQSCPIRSDPALDSDWLASILVWLSSPLQGGGCQADWGQADWRSMEGRLKRRKKKIL